MYAGKEELQGAPCRRWVPQCAPSQRLLVSTHQQQCLKRQAVPQVHQQQLQLEWVGHPDSPSLHDHGWCLASHQSRLC
jgi:hypothetical protein